MHRLSRRPLGYVIAVILGITGIGGLSTALAQQGEEQGQGQTQGQGQGQTTQGEQGQQGEEQGEEAGEEENGEEGQRVVRRVVVARRVQPVVRVARFGG